MSDGQPRRKMPCDRCYAKITPGAGGLGRVLDRVCQGLLRDFTGLPGCPAVQSRKGRPEAMWRRLAAALPRIDPARFAPPSPTSFIQPLRRPTGEHGMARPI